MRILLGALIALFSISSYAQETISDTLVVLTRPSNVINWKVGDTAEYEVSLASMGNLGAMVKSVTAVDEAQNALWLKSDTALMGQKDVSEMLLSRSSGKVLKYIHNGKEEQLPDDSIEVVKTENAEIDVPAGHFKSLHIVANTKQVKGVEVWINQRDTIMDGTLKQTVPTQMGVVEIALAKFHHATFHTMPIPYPLPCYFGGWGCECDFKGCD